MNKKIFKEKQKLPKQKWYYMLYLLFERFKIRYKVDENLYKFSLPILETDLELETENVNVELLREEVFQMYQLASKKRREKYRYNFKKDQFILSVTTFFWSFIFYLSIFFFIIFLILNFLKLENNLYLPLEEASKYKFKDNMNDLLFWYKDKFEEEESEALEDLEELTRVGFVSDNSKLNFETVLDTLGVSGYLRTVLFNFRDLPMFYIKDFLEVLSETWKLDDINLYLQFREMYLDYFLKNL